MYILVASDSETFETMDGRPNLENILPIHLEPTRLANGLQINGLSLHMEPFAGCIIFSSTTAGKESEYNLYKIMVMMMMMRSDMPFRTGWFQRSLAWVSRTIRLRGNYSNSPNFGGMQPCPKKKYFFQRRHVGRTA